MTYLPLGERSRAASPMSALLSVVANWLETRRNAKRARATLSVLEQMDAVRLNDLGLDRAMLFDARLAADAGRNLGLYLERCRATSRH